MNSEQPDPRLAGLPHRVREQLARIPNWWQRYREALRQEPGALWHNPVLRVAGLVLLLLLATVVINRMVQGLIVPGGPAGLADTPTPQATLYVACTNPACRASYTTQQPMSFKDWPLKCKVCGGATVYRATPCGMCRQWYTTAPNEPAGCPFCAERRQAEQEATERQQAPQRPRSPDDAEDPWH